MNSAAEMQAWVGLRECARRCGVSPSTVSAWVNEHGWVRATRDSSGAVRSVNLHDVETVMLHHEVRRGRPRSLGSTPWGLN